MTKSVGEEKMDEPVDFRNFARAMGTVLQYSPGDVIYRENDPPSCMYIILSGAVEIAAHGKIIETIHAGQALGIVSLLDGKPRSSTARVVEPTEIAMMTKQRFRYMVEEVPNVVWYIFGELGHRLRTTNAAL
jgi:CRP-like cAMP-binding protein